MIYSMRKSLLPALLVLGFGFAEGLPINYESIGDRHGNINDFIEKTRSIKECEYILVKKCHEYKFNEFGLETIYLENRRVVKDNNGIIEFEIHKDDMIFIEIYENGQPLDFGFYDDKGVKIFDQHFEYDEQDRLVKHTSRTAFGGEEDVVSVVDYRYNADNSYSAMLSMETTRHEWKYNNKNFLIQTVSQINDEPKIIRNYTYLLDDRGNWIIMYENGLLVKTREFIYFP